MDPGRWAFGLGCSDLTSDDDREQRHRHDQRRRLGHGAHWRVAQADKDDVIAWRYLRCQVTGALDGPNVHGAAVYLRRPARPVEKRECDSPALPLDLPHLMSGPLFHQHPRNGCPIQRDGLGHHTGLDQRVGGEGARIDGLGQPLVADRGANVAGKKLIES